jgi:hypothetical protein
MAKNNHHYTASRRKSTFSDFAKKTKTHKNHLHKDSPANKQILQKIFHPDYILFDWEYFSRELEFE